MREHKYKFYYKNKLIETFTLEEIAEKCDFHWADDVEVVEYTGLKDRNNVEIYEGDIIKYSVPSPDYCFVDEVIFGRIKHHTDHGYYMREYAGFGFKNEHNGGGEEGQIMNTYSLKNMEVIGDIYSNPKLLKEKK